MSEEQLLAEMEKAFAEAAANAPAPQPEIELPVSPVPQKEEIKIEQKPIVSANKQQAAIQLIDTLIAHINNFLGKAQVMVELPGKIQSWIKEGKLKNWPASLTWNTFKAQVEELEAKLNKIKDRDTKTNIYKYLDDFIKDEGLNNNINK